MWRVFRGSFAWSFPPHFHHESTIIYHAKHHVLRTQFRKNPFKNAKSLRRKKFRAAINLKPANKKFAFVHHLGREMVVKQNEELLVAHDLPLPLVAVHNLELVEGRTRELEPLPIDVLKVRSPANRRLLAHRAATHTIHNPLQNPHVFT